MSTAALTCRSAGAVRSAGEIIKFRCPLCGAKPDAALLGPMHTTRFTGGFDWKGAARDCSSRSPSSQTALSAFRLPHSAGARTQNRPLVRLPSRSHTASRYSPSDAKKRATPLLSSTDSEVRGKLFAPKKG